MNAAARLVHRGVVSRHVVLASIITYRQLAVVTLMFGILFSSISIVYMTHLTRLMHANYQKLVVEADQLHARHNQLLLERSAWMMQSRVQAIAKKDLNMQIPDYQSTIIIKE